LIETIYTLTQLKRMSAQDLKKHREEAWDYYAKVKSVQEYKELEE
tara:strand:+ start:2492 stop:2626 length:135 start_codon:yes stop_codon:yes gene_type:complete